MSKKVHYLVHKINFNRFYAEAGQVVSYRRSKNKIPQFQSVICAPFNLIALVLMMSDEKYKRLCLLIEFHPAVTSPYSGP